MKGLVFAKIGIRFLVGIIHKDTYYHVAFVDGKTKRIVIQKYSDISETLHVGQFYFLGFGKLNKLLM